ncbi:MAG: hypothetical protein RQ723_03805 [Desulfuromonadales bacterium]|nr:hypothetical protein [Desulfuromonadales bacterium]
MPRYRLNPRVYVEMFDDAAILFIADREMLVTVNRAAAELYQLFRSSCTGRPFSRQDCRQFLATNYELSVERAMSETARLLGFALRHRIVQRGEVH